MGSIVELSSYREGYKQPVSPEVSFAQLVARITRQRTKGKISDADFYRQISFGDDIGVLMVSRSISERGRFPLIGVLRSQDQGVRLAYDDKRNQVYGELGLSYKEKLCIANIYCIEKIYLAVGKNYNHELRTCLKWDNWFMTAIQDLRPQVSIPTNHPPRTAI